MQRQNFRCAGCGQKIDPGERWIFFLPPIVYLTYPHHSDIFLSGYVSKFLAHLDFILKLFLSFVLEC